MEVNCELQTLAALALGMNFCTSWRQDGTHSRAGRSEKQTSLGSAQIRTLDRPTPITTTLPRLPVRIDKVCGNITTGITRLYADYMLRRIIRSS